MTELATLDETTTDIVPGQIGFNSAQRAMLSQLGLSDAPEGDLILFSHVAQKAGLDPFRREIHMIGRNTKVVTYEPNANGSGQRKVERYETVYTIQTGIQGFRKRAREIADMKGDKLGFDGPYWCGEDGQWREVWPEKAAPVAAKYIVIRNGERIPAVCHHDEFVQTYWDNDSKAHKPNSTWVKMPRNQIAKCAEAAAIQRAYPDELSGLVLEDAAQNFDHGNVIDENGEFAPKTRRGGRGVGGLRDRAAAQVVDGEVVDETQASAGQSGGNDASEDAAAEGVTSPPNSHDQDEPERKVYHLTASARKKGTNRMFALFGEAGIKDDREGRLAVTSFIVGAPIASSDRLTDTQLVELVDKLEAWQKDGTLAVDCAEIIDRPTEPVQEELS